jgi:hypothetical protein
VHIILLYGNYKNIGRWRRGIRRRTDTLIRATLQSEQGEASGDRKQSDAAHFGFSPEVRTARYAVIAVSYSRTSLFLSSGVDSP